jgi:uncharacterized protein (TIGR03083 family)
MDWHTHGAARAAFYTDRLIDFVESLDPEELAAGVPDMPWTAIDVYAHVVTVWRRYTVNPQRAADWRGVARENAADLGQIGRDVPALSRELREHMQRMLTYPDLVPADAQLPFHAGQTLTLAGSWGNALNELLIHGDDISRATGRDWEFDPADTEPFWRYTSSALPGFMSDHGRDAQDRWLLDFGFASGPVHLRFDRGRVTVDEPGPPDYTVSGDPAAITLAMPWHRRKTTDPAVVEFNSRFEAV